MMTTKLAAIVFLLITLQGVGTFFQIKNVQKSIQDARRYGSVAMGSRRGFLGSGRSVILSCNNEGIITNTKIMRGFTVFERYKDISDYNGMTIYEFEKIAIEKAKGKVPDNPRKRSADLQAVLGLINRFNPPESEEEETLKLQETAK